jgi:cell division protein FtsB
LEPEYAQGYAKIERAEEAYNATLAVVDGLRAKRDMLKNKVDRLHPDGADPDLVGELLRENMNVVHPDEIVITLDQE